MPTSEGGYKQFPLEKLFQSANGNFDIQKVHFNDKGHNVISAGESNNGIVGKTDVAARVFSGNTITIDMFGNSYYQYKPYKMVTHARVFSLSPLEGIKMSERIGLYVLAQIKYFKNLFSYDNMCSWEKVRLLTIELPLNLHGDIDFDFMESYTRYIEDYCFRELGLYFEASGFSDCTLTLAEQKAINMINEGNAPTKSIKVGELFDIHPTKSYGQTNETLFATRGNVPVIVNSSRENGVGGWVALAATEKGNMITYSDTTTSDAVFYQPIDFIGYSHVQGLYPFEPEHWNENTCLYFLTLFRKSAGGRFDYATKFTRYIAMDMDVSLPVTDDGSIDYAFMENYINAIKKQTIARVKEYIDSEYRTDEKSVEEQTNIPVFGDYQPGRIPLYNLHAACGYFDENEIPEAEGWLDANGYGFTPDKDRYFAVHAKGDSMLPKIHDGDICIFEWYRAGSRNGEIVLMQCNGIDPDTACHYTIKKYTSRKVTTEESWKQEVITLSPLNSEYEDLHLSSDETYRTIGILKCILG